MENTAGAMGYEVTATAIGKGLQKILEKFNNTVEQRISTTVMGVMKEYSPTKEASNIVGDLTSTLAKLNHNMANLKHQFKMTSDRFKSPPTNSSEANKEISKPQQICLRTGGWA